MLQTAGAVRESTINFQTTMFRYFTLWYSFFTNSLSRELEYRWHFIAQFTMDIVWYAVQLLLFEVLFLYAPTIGGINKTDMHIFLGTLFVIDAMNMTLTSHNFFAFPDLIRSGELDFYLIRPVSTVFMSSFRFPSIGSFMNLLTAISFLMYSLAQVPLAERIPGLLIYPLFVVLGLAVMTAFQLIFMGISVFTVGADGIQWILFTIHNFGMRPDTIYTGFFRKVLLYVFPLSLIASVPARLLFANPDYGLIASSGLCGIAFIYASYRFFTFALTKYSGASS